MARHSHLPVYIKTYESVKLVYRIVRQFRKEYKYTLGAELEQILWQVLDEIIKTNSLPDGEKREGVARISWLFDKFKIRFRFAYEMGLVNSEKFGVAQKMFDEIGNMVGGWQKWAEKDK